MDIKYSFVIRQLVTFTFAMVMALVACNAHAAPDNQKLVDRINELMRDPQGIKSLGLRATRGGVPSSSEKNSLSPFIIGGTNAPRNRYPEYTLVLILDANFDIVGTCGGTMISSNKVLTAGHCSLEPASRYVTVPSFYSFNDNVDQSDLFFVNRVRVHPNFNLQTFSNDVGIITLERNFFGPLSPVVSGDDLLVGQQGVVIGTGLISTNPEDVSDLLQEVPAPITSNAACNTAYDQILGIRPIEDNMMCAGFPADGRGTCSGDSGGPLFVQIGNQRAIAGTVSFGISVCEANRATQAYARMTEFTDFIRSEAPNTSFVVSRDGVTIAPVINLLLDED